MKSSIRQLFNQGSPPVPYAAPGRSVLPMFSGQTQNEIYLRAYGTSGTIYSIVTTLAQACATPQWRLYRKQPQDGRRRYTTGDKGSDQRTEVINHAALTLWSQPNDFYITSEFVTASMQHLELTGECWWVLDRSGPGSFPNSMWLIRPDRMDPVPDPDTFLKGYIYNSPDGQKIPLSLDDVIFTKYPNPLDPYRGLGPVSSILVNVDAMRYANEYNRNYFLNDATPGGVIQVDKRLSDSEWDELTNRWRESHQGVSRAHRVAVLENGAQWNQTSITQKDMDFANLIMTERDVLREAWGIHKSLLGNSDDVNRANAQTAEEVFGNWKILPRLNLLKNALNYRLLTQFGSTGAGVEFDYDNPLPDDREADNTELTVKATAAQLLVNAGWDPDDVLETVGLPSMGVAEKATQQPALPPGWVAAPPAAPAAEGSVPPVANLLRAQKDPQAKVIGQLAKDYPAEAMAWAYHAKWTGPVTVPEGHIDPDMAAFDPADKNHVQDFVDRISNGQKINPVILVKRPGEPLLLLVDGHHRYIADLTTNTPVKAYVATVTAKTGPWETMHSHQAGKSVNNELAALLLTGLTERRALNGSHQEH